MASQSTSGYLTYISLEGCSGCKTFSTRVLPSLLQALPPDVVYTNVSVGRNETGYTELLRMRPVTEYPMLAFSLQPPKYATLFRYLRANSMGSVPKIIAWLDELLPAAPVQEPAPLAPQTTAPKVEPYVSNYLGSPPSSAFSFSSSQPNGQFLFDPTY